MVLLYVQGSIFWFQVLKAWGFGHEPTLDVVPHQASLGGVHSPGSEGLGRSFGVFGALSKPSLGLTWKMLGFHSVKGKIGSMAVTQHGCDTRPRSHYQNCMGPEVYALSCLSIQISHRPSQVSLASPAPKRPEAHTNLLVFFFLMASSIPWRSAPVW